MQACFDIDLAQGHSKRIQASQGERAAPVGAHSDKMDEAAFDHFYRETARPLWSYIHRVCGNATLADDLLQETYYRFLRAKMGIMDEAQMRSYLYKIATNLLNDHWRKQSRERKRLSEGQPIEEAESGRACDLEMERALQELSYGERELVWSAYVEGRRHSEIAEVLGLKQKSVRVLLFRARRKLAGILRRMGFGEYL